MQVLLHSDPNIDGNQPMAEHFEAVVKDALGRFGERVTRVEAHLSGVDGQSKAGARSIECTLEARLVGLDAVVVKDHAANPHQAIEGGVRKLRRAVGAVIGKHDPRHARASAEAEKRRLELDPPAPTADQRGAATDPV